MTIAVDLLVGLAGLGLAAFILHNAQAANGTLATVTNIFSTGTADIRS